jgi:hypothetical protein
MGICTFPKFSGNLDFCPEKSGPFELSAGTFLDFSTFNRKKTGQKDPAGKIFEPYERDAIDWIRFRRSRAPPS